MARYTGPITKKSRRLKVDLVGDDKNFENRPFPPGQHGRGRIQEKEYLTQLQEKQKARFTYGVMEKQFRATTRRPCAAPARPVRTCCRSSSRVWTTSSTAPASPAPVVRPASS
jgi:small subunit ribosomal protein S4